MKNIETLLNALIARGWKPVNLNGVTKCEIADHGIYFYEGECSVEFCSYRELVSLESGLWQFVCKNNLYKKEANNFRENVSKVGNNIGWFNHNYQYRLLEAALIPEEELGKFLVDNIKIEGMMN